MESSGVTTWQPLDIFSPAPVVHKPFALVILNQELKLPLYLYQQLWLNSSFIIAADGGANRLYHLSNKFSALFSNGLSPPPNFPLNAVIGDLDSLLPHVRQHYEEKGIPIIEDEDQYSTDFTKAVKYIRNSLERKDIDIVVLGGLGGRVDQGLSVLHHLYLFQESEGYKEGRMYLLSSEAVTFVLKTGKHEIKAKERWIGIGSDGKGIEKIGDIAFGKHVGILPLKGESMITTKGLEWDVKDWKTVFGGSVSTSNHVKEEVVSVETSEDVLFTIDLDFEGPGS
ncbi:related to thiamine pyrophosphokinase [Phialocephala subalpina]|uniref:Thiamine pyrophosphokinase n=1 Tax=Phialocephala subalpina TaxID=576137 RepID=A0A1L7XIE3_9HELO|nr:related to thiamine pyrophosphokinase [Phialocephala subalpina]